MPTNIKQILSTFGELIVLNDGMESLNKITNFSIKNIDIIFIDIILPKLSGLDVIKKIRTFEKNQNLHRSYIALMIPPYFFNLNKNELLSNGIDKIFVKPIKPNSIKDYLKEINLI